MKYTDNDRLAKIVEKGKALKSILPIIMLLAKT